MNLLGLFLTYAIYPKKEFITILIKDFNLIVIVFSSYYLTFISCEV
jgi:hypothetical protein